jgi:hypothetical protein
MSEDIKEQLLTRIKCSPKFAHQFDESRDVAGLAQLLETSGTVWKKICRKISEKYVGSCMYKAVTFSASLRRERERYLASALI